MATHSFFFWRTTASFSTSCFLLHPAAKPVIVIPLDGADGGRPVSVPDAAAGAPVSQDSELLRPTPPADSQLVVILAACRCPALAIPSAPPCPLLLPPIDWPERPICCGPASPSSSSAPLFSLFFVCVSNVSCSSWG